VATVATTRKIPPAGSGGGEVPEETVGSSGAIAGRKVSAEDGKGAGGGFERAESIYKQVMCSDLSFEEIEDLKGRYGLVLESKKGEFTEFLGNRYPVDEVIAKCRAKVDLSSEERAMLAFYKILQVRAIEKSALTGKTYVVDPDVVRQDAIPPYERLI
jgi:hypothetical protein